MRAALLSCRGEEDKQAGRQAGERVMHQDDTSNCKVLLPRIVNGPLWMSSMRHLGEIEAHGQGRGG